MRFVHGCLTELLPLTVGLLYVCYIIFTTFRSAYNCRCFNSAEISRGGSTAAGSDPTGKGVNSCGFLFITPTTSPHKGNRSV